MFTLSVTKIAKKYCDQNHTYRSKTIKMIFINQIYLKIKEELFTRENVDYYADN